MRREDLIRKNERATVKKIIKHKKYKLDNYVKSKFEKSYNSNRFVYDKVIESEKFRIFHLNELSPKDQLGSIKDEILVRVKITKQEIFKIGELLHLSKRICQEQKIRFQKWISENFDFSYETAKNFMNVYKQCMGIPEIALKMPASVLYKFSAPSFPDELRDHLIAEGSLEKMTNKKITSLRKKFEEGGIDLVNQHMNFIERSHNDFSELQFSIATCRNASKLLEGLERILSQRIFRIGFKDIPYDNVQSDNQDIMLLLYDSIASTQVNLSKAIKEAENQCDEIRAKIKADL